MVVQLIHYETITQFNLPFSCQWKQKIHKPYFLSKSFKYSYISSYVYIALSYKLPEYSYVAG